MKISSSDLVERTKSENGEFFKSKIILSAALQTYEAQRVGGGDVRGMKGAVTAVTQSYIFVPRTVNIHEDICLEFDADVQRCTRHKE